MGYPDGVQVAQEKGADGMLTTGDMNCVAAPPHGEPTANHHMTITHTTGHVHDGK